MANSMLTTVDNPYDPFTEWPEWLAFDTRMGYNTIGLLARIANDSHEMSESDEDLVIESAMDEIVKENVSGIHMKVTREESELTS